jgi:ankyrin repeat protein
LSEGQSIASIPEEYFPDYSNLSPTERLIEAAKFNDMDQAEKALKDGAQADYFVWGKGSPLDAAIIGSDMEVIELLFEKGAKETPNSKNAAEFMNRRKVLELLEKYGDERRQKAPIKRHQNNL